MGGGGGGGGRGSLQMITVLHLGVQENNYSVVGDINLNYTIYFMMSTVIIGFFGVIIGSRKKILAYCDSYHKNNPIMPFVAVSTPIGKSNF